MEFINEDGSILVPRLIRPIVEYDETSLGAKKGSIRQYRYRNLHVREYFDYYAIHVDRIDPRKDPIGHLMLDAPEYLAATAIAISCLKAAKNLADNLHKR